MASPGDGLAKMNKDARAMIHMAFDDLGGVERLVKWANDPEHPGNLSQFYTQIWSKIIPREIKAEHTGKEGGPIIISWQGPTLEALPADSGVEDAELVDGRSAVAAVTFADEDELDSTEQQ